MHSRRERQRGAALLEVLVGLTMLAWAGASWIALMRQAHHSIAVLRSRERQFELASEELDRMTIWTRSDFLARVGGERLGAQGIRIEQVSPVLFAVTIADSATGASMLTTMFYLDAGRTKLESRHAPSR